MHESEANDDGGATELLRGHERCPRCSRPVTLDATRCDACGASLVAAPELPVGARVGDGRYEILSVIGRGGFGITYEAGDARLHRRVAIKELFPETAVRDGSRVLTPPEAREAFRAARERFLREARVLARFTHGGIVRVYEVFEEHGTAYLVMELLGGCPLVEVLRSRGEPFTEDEVLDVAGRVAAALRPVHAAGVLHRDLNPSNVMLTEHGRIVLIDFGLARDFDPEQTMGMTRVVTPGYAPLEQYRGEARFGPSTDVYGLAATLYRLSTGRVPVAAVARDAGAALPAVHRANPAISKSVSDAIGDGLELEPGHRPQDLDTFLARLGIRRLPEGPRSILLGSPGAEPERLRRPETERPSFAEAPPASPAPLAPPPGALEAPSAPTSAVGPPATVAGVAADRTDVDPDRTVHEPLVARAPLGDATQPDPARGADPDRTRPAGPVPTTPLVGAPAPPGLPPLQEPHAVGSAPAGTGARRSVLLPLLALALSAGATAPVMVVSAVVLVVLPVLATWGDLEVRRQRIRDGVAEGWSASRAPEWSVAGARFARNVVASTLRCSPIVGVGAVLLGVWYLVAETSLGLGLVHGLLRLIGAGTVAALLLGSAQGSDRFRSGLGIDALVDRLAPEGQMASRHLVAWVVVAALVAGLLWLDPDPFPLP